jgi:hypothetical protein
LDYRTIGNRIAIGKSNFGHRTTQLIEQAQDPSSERHVWIARRDEWHKCLSAFGLQSLKQLLD